MLTFPFSNEAKEGGAAGSAWNFSKVDCHVSGDVFLETAPPFRLEDHASLVAAYEEYRVRLYCLIYPLLDFRTNPDLEEIRTFVLASPSRNLLIVHCHGARNTESWVLADTAQPVPADEYLRRVDGQYACIVCLACNPQRAVPMLAQSALIFYRGFSPGFCDANILDGGTEDLYCKLPHRDVRRLSIDRRASMDHFRSSAEEGTETVDFFEH